MFEGSIFLYHSELWTLHHRQLRYAIRIVYPRVISNAKLYELAKAEPWSKTIEIRRHFWIGHLMRLDPTSLVGTRMRGETDLQNMG